MRDRPNPAHRRASLCQQQSRRSRSALAPLAVIALDRLAWGPKPGDPTTSVEAFNALGADDDARLAAWVTQQLDPTFLGQPDDSDTRIANAAAVLPSLNLSLPQLWATYYTATSPDRDAPARDVRVATLIRAATSRRQLYEVMVDFWHNHFSIYAWGSDYASATWASYDRDVIRANALGNFRTLVEKVAKSTAMLYYLDNYISQGASFNENWGASCWSCTRSAPKTTSARRTRPACPPIRSAACMSVMSTTTCTRLPAASPAGA